ncbi:MAG: ATP-binding protein [Planctomycetota bacterium]|nr:ATP-binding protein [Planctomycetota bacterium]
MRMRFRDLRIKWKLPLTAMAISLMVLLAAGGLLFAHEYSAVREAMERDLAAIGQVLAANSTAALSFEDPQAGEETLRALAAKAAVEAACLYDADGRLFATYVRDGNLAAPPERPAADGFEAGAESLSFFGPVLLRGRRIGTIHLRSDFSQLDGWLSAYAKVCAGILALTGVLAFALTSILQRPLLAPIEELTETARRVSEEKDYALRGRKRGEDELGFLIDRFNEMLAAIQSRDAELVRAREELEERVEARTRDLKEANKELEAFSYSVAHDLRAPLRSIDGFSMVLLEDYSDKLDETGRGHLDRVRMATQRMAQLLDDMLNLSRVTRRDLKPTGVDMSRMAEEVFEDLRVREPQRQVEAVVAPELRVEADPGLLRIALENLIGNAWKFTGKSAAPRIELGIMNDNGRPTFYVKDNGAGFDMAYAKKLFGVFQRLHAATEFPGTGVGLATVQRIVNRHGGRIWAEAEPGKGASFYFTLKD